MIIGIGTDLIEIDRIRTLLTERSAQALDRLFTLNEQKASQKAKCPYAYFAKRFAGKEALVKALQTGFTQGITWQDMEILNDAAGAPTFSVSGKAQEILNQRVGTNSPLIHISLTDTDTHAQAFVVIEAKT